MNKFTKYLILPALAVFPATYTFAQTPKSCNLEATLITPAANSVINFGDLVTIKLAIKNNGPHAIVPADYLFIGFSGDTDWEGYFSGVAILAGDTYTYEASYTYTNTTATDRVVNFCARLLPQANRTIDGNPVPVTYIDPDTTNDRSCHTITLKAQPSGIFDTKAAKETLNLFPNPATNKVGFRIALDKAETVAAAVRDLTGREVMTQNFGQIQSGTATALELNVAELNNGIYVVEVVAGDKRFIGKVAKKD